VRWHYLQVNKTHYLQVNKTHYLQVKKTHKQAAQQCWKGGSTRNACSIAEHFTPGVHGNGKARKKTQASCAVVLKGRVHT
jgi:hypothetical protein